MIKNYNKWKKNYTTLILYIFQYNTVALFFIMNTKNLYYHVHYIIKMIRN
jgi:hypothetical protein